MSMLNKAIRKSLLIGLLTLIASPIVAYADPPGAQIRRGYRLSGTSYSQLKVSQHECKRTCDISAECRAWNYNAHAHDGYCQLLSTPGRPSYRDGYVSAESNRRRLPLKQVGSNHRCRRS